MNNQSLPPVPAKFQLPFYYASLWNCEVLYLVDAKRLSPFLAGSGLEVVKFGNQGCASFNYQLYSGQFQNGSSITQELELNILAYPQSAGEIVPSISFEEFVRGEDQTKTMGNHRVRVPCDDPVAIDAGKTLFGEPKFRTTFTVDMPSLNGTNLTTWKFTVNDPKHPKNKKGFIFTCVADLSGLSPQFSNPSPLTVYGKFKGRPIGARWNILQPFQTYFLKGEQQRRVRLIYGQSSHPMRDEAQRMIGKARPLVVRTFQSTPAATQSRAFYV